jgi:hypothetical protein
MKLSGQFRVFETLSSEKELDGLKNMAAHCGDEKNVCPFWEQNPSSSFVQLVA